MLLTLVLCAVIFIYTPSQWPSSSAESEYKGTRGDTLRNLTTMASALVVSISGWVAFYKFKIEQQADAKDADVNQRAEIISKTMDDVLKCECFEVVVKAFTLFDPLDDNYAQVPFEKESGGVISYLVASEVQYTIREAMSKRRPVFFDISFLDRLDVIQFGNMLLQALNMLASLAHIFHEVTNGTDRHMNNLTGELLRSNMRFRLFKLAIGVWKHDFILALEKQEGEKAKTDVENMLNWE